MPESNDSSLNLSDVFIAKLLKDIHDEIIDPENLSEELYYVIAEKLKEGLFKGFGGTVADFDGKPAELLEKLRENIYHFSAAKTFQQTLEMSEALIDENGNIRTWSEFRDVAADIFAKYNGGDYLQDDEKAGYLQAEYETAITQGQNAENWTRIEAQKKTLPYLRKNVVEDENTCEICGPLNGFTAPVDDPVWDSLAGELHFRCRCFEEQLDVEEGEANYDEDKKDELFKSQTELMKPMFKHNVYKSGEIFNKESPMFSVPKEYKEFARSNFGLPIPEPAEDVPAIHPFMPDAFKDWGVNLDDSVYDLLTKKVTALVSKKDSYAIQAKSEIHIAINNQRWKDSEFFQKNVLYHELGHIIHYQQGIIDFGSGVSDEFKEVFTKFRKTLLSDLDLANYEKIGADIYNSKEVDSLLEKYGAKTVGDLKNMYGATSDTIASLTNAKYGFGHTKAYFKIKGAKEAEMFAHCMENAFHGNPIFKDLMPNLYKETIDYIKTIKK